MYRARLLGFDGRSGVRLGLPLACAGYSNIGTLIITHTILRGSLLYSSSIIYPKTLFY